ncbi:MULTISPECIES: gas vesicle protein GvpJ [Streptomyces]|uniref:Gas vesicle protein A n=2 Tax=Streptomyces TaxID=1883 RepID=A0ABV4ZU29_9ACTN|nr:MULTISPECIES: gas vesicle protein GvpJ [Streptomyces]MCK1815122.1 gas vesicle protein [Streptomyces sp. XM4011]QKV71666.1 gas vesicle protein [Streptomyces harbinensis]UWM52158.1 gas vesicle protein [Streptomyces carpaticus]
MSTTTTTYRDDVACVPRTGTLYDVIDIILDRGMVIDVFLRVSLVGIEIVKVDIRIVIASVDTYLRFAEACNRMDLEADTRSRTVPELFGGAGGGGMVRKAGEKGAKHAAKAGEKKAKGVAGKAKKAAGGAKDKVRSALPGRLGEAGD